MVTKKIAYSMESVMEYHRWSWHALDIGGLSVCILETEFFYMHHYVVPAMTRKICEISETLLWIPPAYYFKSAYFEGSRVAQYHAQKLVANLRESGKTVWSWHKDGLLTQATWWEKLTAIDDMVNQLCLDGSQDRQASIFGIGAEQNSSYPNWLPYTCGDPNAQSGYHYYLTEPAELSNVMPGNVYSIRCKIVSGKSHYAQLCVSGANRIMLDRFANYARNLVGVHVTD